jgi:hypothetical protein
VKGIYWLHHVRPSVCLSFHPFIVYMGHMGSHWMNSHEIWYLSIFQKYVEKIKVSLKGDNYNWYFIPDNQYTFWIISHSVLLRMRNVSDTNYRDHNTHLCSMTFFFQNSCNLWDNVINIVEPDRPQITIQWMCCVCQKTKSTDTHSYVIHIAFL